MNRILLVSLDNLGDLVFASALAPPLRERYPNATLDVWCKRYTADVATLVPGVGEVLAADPFWDRAPGRRKGAVAPFLRSIREVRRRRYDLAVLAAAPWRTAAAVAATRIPKRIGLRRRKNRIFLTHALREEDHRRPVLAELSRLLGPLDIAPPELRYRLDPAPLAERQRRLRERLPARFAALHPFASKRNRCVVMPVWLELSRRLAARGLETVWIGSAIELDEVRALGATPTSRFVDRESDGSLADSAAVLAMAALFVGHDSGPLHVAGAFGVPCIGVFAPGEPLRTFPQGVGPSRMLARHSPDAIAAADVMREIDALPRSVARGA
jgi:ADP-heptose:LPS heptosyltransferase